MRLKKRLVKWYIYHFGSHSDSKQFRGNQFDRLEGLEYILDRCAGLSVLDLGSNTGLVAYEFAKRGASKIIGYEIDKRMINLSNNIFQYVEVPHKFIRKDLLNIPEFLPQIDITLFLDMFHHLTRQTAYFSGRENEDKILRHLKYYLANTKKYFIVSPGHNPKINKVIRNAGFKHVYFTKRKSSGTLGVFKRI